MSASTFVRAARQTASWAGRMAPPLLALLASTLTACSPGAARPARPDARLSDAERAAIASPGASTAQLAVLHADGSVEVATVAASEIAAFEAAALARDPGAVIAWNAEVGVNAEDPSPADENLLFRGKTELGLPEWEKLHPEADGRGVTVGVVDDGTALNLAGLRRGTDGAPKFAGFFNASPLWQLPVREPGFACEGLREVRTRAVGEKLTLPDPLNARVTRRVPFDFTSCGINPELPLARASQCAKWNKSIPALAPAKGAPENAGPRALAAAYFELTPEGEGARPAYRVGVDLNDDGALAADEVFAPLSERGDAHRALPGGNALGFDVYEVNEAPSALGAYPQAARDHAVPECAREAKVERLVSLAPPHEDGQFGSHGEGVSGIAVGHRIGGRPVDGIAPGARLFDVHFADEVGGRRYTIAEVTRSLLAAGRRADIVNLSYSLFFQHPAAQLAMSRFMTAALEKTEAVYLFSAGNNGPGRGSMNRALLYPRDAIVVGAWLDPALAQTTFGSSLPFGGVVSYSSRGPAPDGGFGPTLLGPLAGMTPSTPDQGFRPFSGTSSATPAISGLTARLISRLRAEGLPVRRDWIRRALIASARPLAGVPAIDQGAGLPWLPDALTAYRALARGEARPELAFSGAGGPFGVPRRGIYVRGETDRRDVYSFTLSPVLTPAGSPSRAEYAETVRIEATADWVRVPPAAFVSAGGANIDVAIDWDRLSGRPGEHLAEVRVRDLQNPGAARAVLPVTVIVPDSAARTGRREVVVRPGELTRWTIARPAGATTHLVLSRESRDAGQPLCGRFNIYDPSGGNAVGAIAGAALPGRAEVALPAAEGGVYEITWLGGTNHTVCPREQRWEIAWHWHELDVTPYSVADDRRTVELAVRTPADFARGRLRLSDPATVHRIELRRESPWTYASEPVALPLPERASWSARLAAPAASPLPTLGYWTLDYARADRREWPVQAALPVRAGAAPVALEPQRLGTGLPAVPVVFGLTAFELGADPRFSPVTIALEVRVREAFANDSVAESPAFEARRDTPAIVSVKLQPDTEGTESWRCAFRPAGFDLELPCPDVALPAE